jgi:hypothetical protein
MERDGRRWKGSSDKGTRPGFIPIQLPMRAKGRISTGSWLDFSVGLVRDAVQGRPTGQRQTASRSTTTLDQFALAKIMTWARVTTTTTFQRYSFSLRDRILVLPLCPGSKPQDRQARSFMGHHFANK